MFERLSNSLSSIVQGFAGQGLTESNIRDTCSKFRRALIDADVAVEVVNQMVAAIERRAFDEGLQQARDPGEIMVAILRDELIASLGGKSIGLNMASVPTTILMAGLQGTGKTTTVAKLARFLIERERRKVSVVSADVYRPAAIEQLRVLSEEVGARFIASEHGQFPIAIAEAALRDARRNTDDALIVDTAGRLAIDETMMAELASIHEALNPAETLFVVDAMTGQDAAMTARQFDQALPLTGVVISKIDGDARGGAALSVKAITGKPIKFLGVGEKSDALELFHPDRIASRLLGMGDIQSLVEEAGRKVDTKRSTKIASKLVKQRKFNLEDMKTQLEELNKLGGMNALLKKLPSAPRMKFKSVEDEKYTQMIVIINSMTVRERRYPDLLNPSRKQRIATGSGTTVQDVNALLRQFKQMQKQTRKMGRMGKRGKAMRKYADLIDSQFSQSGIKNP